MVIITDKEAFLLIKNFEEFVRGLDEGLKPSLSFDLIKRELIVAERTAYLYFIDGFIKDEVFEKIVEFLFKQTPQTLAGITDMNQFSKDKMPYVEIDYTYNLETAKTSVLSGPAVLVIDGIAGALIIDTRTYPVRSIEEPQQDKALRGARDGFVETIIFNTAMIRRRIRTENLRMEHYQIGNRSKVDVAIGYIEGLADEKQLNALRKRLKAIKINGISMTQQVFCETLIPSAFINPFPKVKFTERPDFASACILDGKIVLIMDNSPAVMILPNTFADFFRDVDDYYFMPIVGTYTRIIRILVALLTLLAGPLYLLVNMNPQYLPDFFKFILPDKMGSIPLFYQLLLLEFIVDGLQLASLNTPDSLSNSLGIIGGLLLSEFAITAGWFIPEAILFIAFVTIASFSQPSFEMGYAMKFERIALLVAVHLFGLWGFIITLVAITISLICMNTITGHNYLYPLFPFNFKHFIKLFIRPGIGKNH